MAFLRWLLYGLRTIGSLFAPFAGGLPAIGKGLLWALHVIVVVGTLIGLHYLNHLLGFHRMLPGKSRLVRENWLPIIFILLYVIGWLGWYFWELVKRPAPAGEYADIALAWDEAMAALERAGIDIKHLPVFLILGRPASSMEALFQGSRQRYTVWHAPRGDGPLAAYATDEAVYLTCPGCSLLGEYGSQLAGAGYTSGGEQPSMIESDDCVRTRPPRAAEGEDEIGRILKRAGREGRGLTRQERRQVRFLARRDPSYRSCVRDADEAARCGGRFEAFCRLLAQERTPYVPINGVFILVPFAATDSDQDALDCGAAIGQDLAVVHRVLQVRAPTVAVLCDLESATGFSEFVGHFNEKDRLQRIGQRCPKVPHLESPTGSFGQDTREYARTLQSLASWVGTSVPTGWVYRHFRLDRPGFGDEYAGIVRTNARLFLFMNDMKERESRLRQVLTRGLVGQDRDLPFFAGCYMAATGSDPDGEQAFVAGVFRRFLDRKERLEEFVTWTDQALSEEAEYVRATGIAQIALGVLLISLVGLLSYVFV